MDSHTSPNSPNKTRKKHPSKSPSSSNSNTNEAPGPLSSQKRRVALPIVRRSLSERIRTLKAKALAKQKANVLAAHKASIAAAEANTFKRNNVFKLAGHGLSILPDTYKLNTNEFYTTSTLCGYIAYASIKEHYKFVTHRHHIRVPKPTNTSFWNEDVNALFQGVTKQKPNYYADTNGEYSKERSAYKMYVPFVSDTGSNTIYNITIQPFTFWKILDISSPSSPSVEFSYKGKSKLYEDLNDLSKFNVYRIAISGVLASYKNYVKTEEALDEDVELRTISERIVEYFKVPEKSVRHDLFLYICIPRVYSNTRIFSDIDDDDPLIAYTRDAIKTVYLDSVVPLKKLYGEDVTFTTIFKHKIPMSTLYPLIKSTVGIPDDEPMLLINNLCRNYVGYNAPHVVNSNDNVDPRSYMLSSSSFKNTRRAKLLRTKTVLNVREQVKSQIGKYVAFNKITNATTRHSVMKYILTKRKITHAKYAKHPEAVVKYLAIITGFTQKIWREFLASLPKSEFAAP